MRREIDAALLAGLQTQAAAQGATLFMALLAAFGTLLYRYSSESDLRIGVPSSGRDSVETENLIGFFVNTLVVRQQVAGNLPFGTLLAQTRQTLLDAQAHRALPFARLVRSLQTSRTDDTPLFHAMFSMQRSDRAALLSLPGLSVTTREIETGAAQFDCRSTSSNTITARGGEHRLCVRALRCRDDRTPRRSLCRTARATGARRECLHRRPAPEPLCTGVAAYLRH